MRGRGAKEPLTALAGGRRQAGRLAGFHFSTRSRLPTLLRATSLHPPSPAHARRVAIPPLTGVLQRLLAMAHPI